MNQRKRGVASAVSDRTRAVRASVASLALATGMAAFTQSVPVLAGVPVSSVLVEPVQATPFRYEVDGETYTWGVGNNEVMHGFIAGDRQFGYSDSVSRVELRRNAIAGSGESTACEILVERLDDTASRLAADYPSNSRTGRCDVASVLQSRVLNRGALDLFSNVSPDAKNIERADFIFNHGALAPFDPQALDAAGHIVAETRGGTPVGIAAITALDVFGQPSGYGPLVTIAPAGCADGEICFADTGLVRDFGLFQNRSLLPDGYPALTELATDAIAVAFVTAAELGLHAGQRYHGFSLFAADVDADVHVMTDPTTFPTDTLSADAPDGTAGVPADFLGGLAGYFLANDLPVVDGRVFLDSDGDELYGDGDAGVGDIGMQLYSDVDGDGVLDTSVDLPLSDTIDTDTGGVYRFPGLPDGDYLLVADANDPDIPGGLMLAPGYSPAAVSVVDGRHSGWVDFPLIAIGSGGDGSGTGGSTDGAGDDGASDGASDGTGDGGETDGAGDGGETDGAGDSGETDGAGEGGETDGAGDDGATDGAGDGGATDGDGGDDGATVGGDDGATDGDGTTDGSTSGATDSGATDGGTEDDDSVTAALPDSYEVNQGDVLIAPVLDNDSSAVDGVLTIVGVSESANALIDIVGDTVSYTPDSGFHGVDSFTYTINDAEGTPASAAVTVTVLRFSDINGNLLNDFDECAAVNIDCTDLQLETGVNGSGIGRIAPGLLALLAGMAWQRRRIVRIVTQEARA